MQKEKNRSVYKTGKDVSNQFSVSGKGCMTVDDEEIPHIPDEKWIKHKALTHCDAKICVICGKIVDIRMGHGN